MSLPTIGLVDAHSGSLDSFIHTLVHYLPPTLPFVFPQRWMGTGHYTDPSTTKAARNPGGWHDREQLSMVLLGLYTRPLVKGSTREELFVAA
jgi:hypothetical protein